MRNVNIFAARLATLLVLHTGGAGLASPTVVTRPASVQWLPTDNQTVYTFPPGEIQSLELNTSSISAPVYVTVSPCTRDVRWALFRGHIGNMDDQLTFVREYIGRQMTTLLVKVSPNERYVLQLSSEAGGAAAVSVRGEPPRAVRLRLRVRSRRRLSANWDPSPIDPQTTTYCIVASHRMNYTSLCAAQYDSNPTDCVYNRQNRTAENRVEEFYSIHGGDIRRRKYGRSTKVSDEDPLVTCVGVRTHHLIENLDPSTTYFVSVFAVARDRRAGSLLATGSVRPKSSPARRLRENTPYRTDIKGKSVFYFKANVGSPIFLSVSTCGGTVDIEVLVKGKQIHIARNIDRYLKFSVEPTNSIQETSDEGSVQFESSSEEAKVRYVVRIRPSRLEEEAVGVELTASTSRWGVIEPELSDDSATVRELRPKRTCSSIDVAFLPASHYANDVIRYCIVARETNSGNLYSCSPKVAAKACFNRVQRPASRVIKQKITGLNSARKYAIQVTASSKGISVPYKTLYVDFVCDE
ncbi:protein NDNF-like [Leguminivora glycinivorella]|uniref:protein NDNF-like n=1 Tax=Leguminivora glycinivorella TaxID=1035111 RepID=UPI00200E3B72|nr:protein NDNF-like [Leguminivora glycinivorella]